MPGTGRENAGLRHVRVRRHPVGSQLRIGRVAQLLASAIVGGAPPRRAEQVPLLCPPLIVQVTRLLTLMGASVTSSDLRQEPAKCGYHTIVLLEAASEDPFLVFVGRVPPTVRKPISVKVASNLEADTHVAFTVVIILLFGCRGQRPLHSLS